MLAPWIIDEIRREEERRQGDHRGALLPVPEPVSRPPDVDAPSDEGSSPVVLDILGDDESDSEGPVVVVP